MLGLCSLIYGNYFMVYCNILYCIVIYWCILILLKTGISIDNVLAGLSLLGVGTSLLGVTFDDLGDRGSADTDNFEQVISTVLKQY